MTFKKEYALYYDLFNNTKNYDAEVEYLDAVFKKYQGEVPIQTILDLGCGTGIHAEYLAKKGYHVTGIDLSSDMIAIAQEKNITNTAFHVGDMSNFELNKTFDSCLIMFAALGYLNDNKQIASCFSAIKKHLKPGGLLVLDVWNGLGVMHELPSVRTKEVDAGEIHIKRTSNPDLEVHRHVSNVRFDVEISKNGELIDKYEEDHAVRFFFPQELKKYLEDAGFEVLDICKLFEPGTTVSVKDWNMSIIARAK